MLPLLVFPDKGDFWTGLAVTVTRRLLASTLLAPFCLSGYAFANEAQNPAGLKYYCHLRSSCRLWSLRLQSPSHN